MSSSLLSHCSQVGDSMCLSSHPTMISMASANELQSSVYETHEDDPVQYESVKFQFRCVLAEGSQMCLVANFSSMVELYEKIAQCFDMSAKEIMYCTLNTAKVDMDHVLGGQIGLEDTIYVHRRGATKHVEVKKTERFLGLTIADNGNGCSYIKKIKQDSTASRVPFIKVGDHIESIMDQNMVGCRHYEVARFLKTIPLDEIFTLTLVEPVSSGFQQLSPRKAKTANLGQIAQGNNKGTLRIRSNEIEMMDQECHSNVLMATGLRHINKKLEKFIGINDDELAEELWRLAVQKKPHEFALSVEHSELSEFKFTNHFIFDVWAIVDDVLNGRIPCTLTS